MYDHIKIGTEWSDFCYLPSTILNKRSGSSIQTVNVFMCGDTSTYSMAKYTDFINLKEGQKLDIPLDIIHCKRCKKAYLKLKAERYFTDG